MTDTVPAFPGTRDMRHPLDPPQLHRQLKPIQRVSIWDGSTPWAVSTNALYKQLLTDPRLSNDIRRDGYPAMTAVFKQLRVGGGFESFDRRDGEEHESVRRVLMGNFSFKKIEPMRPTIQAAIDEIVDEILEKSGPVDLVAEIAYPLTTRIICGLLGVPLQDYELFSSNVSGMTNTESPERAIEAHRAMQEYIGTLVDRSVETPVDGLVGNLVTSQLITGKMTREQVVGMGISVLIAGYETSAKSMALGTVALMAHRDQWEDLVANADDPQLASSTAEEVLRFNSITHKGRRRVATRDIEVEGVVIKAGEGVVFLDDIANRDPNAFSGDPYVLDIRRDNANHVAFAVGPHHCIGNRLARLELQVYFATIARRIPSLRLVDAVEDLDFHPEEHIYGLYNVPITWASDAPLPSQSDK